MEKKRNSNLELYRILVMFSIVAHHYVVNSGLLDMMEDAPASTRSIYYYLFGAWGKVGINCFVLITGYFMCKTHITLQKFLKLFLEVIFYLVIINGVLIIAGIEELTVRNIYKDFQMVFDVSTHFVSCFIFFFLLIPFLNSLVNNINRTQHLWLIAFLLFIYTGVGTLMLGKVNLNYITWFSVIYLISSYIRFYQPMQKVKWGLATGGVFLLSVASILVILYIRSTTGLKLPPYHFVNDSNKVLAVALSISMFMWFKDMNVPQSKIINRIAQSCFGVLLIHANSNAMRKWLWYDTLDVAAQFDKNTFILHSVLSVIAIYIICTIIDQLRIACVEKPFFKWMNRKDLYSKKLFKYFVS